MPEDVSVRRLGIADVGEYRAIRLAALKAAPEAFGSIHDLEASRPIAHFAERLTSSSIFGAYDGGQITGMVGLRQHEGPKECHKGFVWGFFVAPGGRRRGVGTALMAAVLQAAQGRVEQVTLTVVADNAAAIALYDRLGFIRYGVEPRALKTGSGYSDEALMVLFLGLGPG